MIDVCVFWDDVGDDGWAKVTRIHHKPAKLDPKTRKAGLVCSPGPAPEVKPGWTAGLWVHPETEDCEWRVRLDAEYRMSAAEFLLLLPVQTRIQCREAAEGGDPVMQDFLDMIDKMIADNASSGLHPGGAAAKAALAYLVEQDWMTLAQADAITEA